jgi:antitoxin (DNA-binding transcriptional repressor) of toxin-antitoxin stability system
MERAVQDFEARDQFDRMLEEIRARGERFVVERQGEAVAAVVPIAVYQQWKRTREEFLGHMREVADRAQLSPEEADELAAEAVRAIRADSPA